MISNCNCAEMIECGCELEFDYYETGTASVLTVGELVDVGSGSNCGFTDYVIDWYYEDDTDIKFTTGIGSDPDIVYTHPFIGNESIPVVGGTWKPVVRYIVVDGEKVFTTPKPCQKWCDMAINLPEIEVNPLTCSSSVGPYELYYTHKLEYNCLINSVEKASQSVKFILDTDGSTLYFAWRFYGYQVSDRITITYCDVNDNEITTFEDWVVGTDVTWGVYSSPRHFPGNLLNRVIVLPAYTSGDYLLITITPSYVSGNPLTNWILYMKCLETFSCIPELTADMQTTDPDTISVIYNATNCRYEVSFETLAIPPSPYLTDIAKYMGIGQTWTTQGSSTSFYDGKVTFYIYDELINGSLNSAIGIGTRIIQNDNCTIVKSGTTLTITFENETDYLAWKTSWNNVLANAHWTDYSTDPTSELHYKYIVLSYRDVLVEGTPGSSCGDPGTEYGFYISYDSVYDSGTGFDDVNFVITIELIADVNGYVNADCESVYESIANVVNYTNGFISSANFSRTINCRYTSPFGLNYVKKTTSPAQTSFKYWESFTSYDYIYDDGPCELWNLADTIIYSGFYKQYYFYTAGMYVTLTEDSGTVYWHAYSIIDTNGHMLTNVGDYTLIAEGEVA